MQIIHDSNAVFDISVNPFLRCVTIEHFKSSLIEIWNYEHLDEWKSFRFGDNEYDFHFLYDERMEFSIYPVMMPGVTDTLTSIPYNLSIEF